MHKNQTNILLAIGLIISSITQIISHFNKMPDFISGSLIGVGLGFLIMALIKIKQNQNV